MAGWLYKRSARSVNDMTDISLKARNILDEKYEVGLTVPSSVATGSDGTKKYLFPVSENKYIESAYIPDRDRATICVSVQSGCRMGCRFCMTAKQGFQGNLSSCDILNQFRSIPEHSLLTNIVYMGMGEPFLNYEATMDSIQRLMDPRGLNFGARRITISTVGIVPKIEQFTKENLQVNLAVSLHAADDSLRSQLVPANRMFPLSKLIPACKAYTEQTHRRISFEYALIDGVNDSHEAALGLSSLLRGMLCHVNLIALNPSKKYPLQGSPKTKVHAFSATLEEHGIPVTIRLRRGVEIQAGCGQLASAEKTFDNN